MHGVRHMHVCSTYYTPPSITSTTAPHTLILWSGAGNTAPRVLVSQVVRWSRHVIQSSLERDLYYQRGTARHHGFALDA